MAAIVGSLASLSAVALMGVSAWLISTAAEMPPVLTLSVAAVSVRFFALARALLRYLERLLAHYRSHSHHANYLTHSEIARDQVDWNPEYSRRGRGFPTYAAIASLGREGITQIVDNCCRHAHAIVTGAGKLDGVEVLHVPHINQGLLRFLAPKPGATDEDHDRQTEMITARIVASGEAMFACTTWRGIRCMRVSVSGWQTDENDVDRTVKAIAAALKS